MNMGFDGFCELDPWVVLILLPGRPLLHVYPHIKLLLEWPIITKLNMM